MQRGGETEQQAEHVLQEIPAQPNTPATEAGDHQGAHWPTRLTQWPALGSLRGPVSKTKV